MIDFEVSEENKNRALAAGIVIVTWITIRSAIKSGGKAVVKYAIKSGITNINVHLLS